LLNFAAILVALAYPLNAGRHRLVREAIQKRRRGEPYVDPLRR
jgi:hypothetical protein